jgi:hypothetical protein
VSLFRRLLGRPGEAPVQAAPPRPGADVDDTADRKAGDASLGRAEADEEAARDRELLRADAERLADELLQRQLRYADRSWTPPSQGGPRRADDEDGERS